jgi:paraquat-inducible protein B
VTPIDEPDIYNNRTFNFLTSIWIVPVIALIVSGWLVYQHFSNLGSEITIDFPNSDGLIPGESVIKFRDVAVGKITRITLQEGGDGVRIYARMNKEAEPYLNASTHFWIVSPQVDYSGVRGLDTLIHGAYIAMSSERKGKLVTEFIGSDKPWRNPNEGRLFRLRARSVGNIHVGAPVYYRSLRTGVIENIALSSDKRMTDITIFIHRDYADLVNETTKFWHQDLVALRMEEGEISLDLAPITSVLLGSIRFESKLDRSYPSVPNDHVFELYDKRSEAMDQRPEATRHKPMHFAFDFRGNVSRLRVGAPIRYEGFKVGSIEQVKIRYDAEHRTMAMRAIGSIDIALFDSPEHNGSENLVQAVRQGLHAEVVSDNMLLESLAIDLIYAGESNTTDLQQKSWTIAGSGPVLFPTHQEVQKKMFSRFNRLVDEWSRLAHNNNEPLRRALVSLHEALENINKLTSRPSFQKLTDDLNVTMGRLNGLMGEGGGLDQAIRELESTLKTTKRVMRGYSNSSLFGKKLDAMLKEIGQTTEETKRLIEKLNKKPNALIFGD